MPAVSKTRETTAPMNGLALASVAGTAGNHRSPRTDDTMLVRQAQQGDTAAFEELVRQYDRVVLRLAMNITGSQEDAQDIYQEAFLRAYMNLNRFRFECSFYTWIYRIATNLCLDHLRRQHMRNRDMITERYNEDEEDNSVMDRVADQSPTASPERALRSRELRDRILRALRRLSPRERMVFELKHYQGLKLQTVAVMLNTTENTIKNTLFRATQKLRTELAVLV
ncbi:MAG: RNA polymerase subunit sigma-24 [Acidobacteria bacterium]|nr:MAG: RNA polymerase subunit sigma-24 [Acidobacteriota bacterium]